MDTLALLFEQHFGSAPTRMHPVQGGLGGSGRIITRLANDTHSAIGILNENTKENAAFLEFSDHFRKYDLAVPEIYRVAETRNAYLEQDLGDTTLFHFLARNRSGSEIAPEAVNAYRKVVEALPRFQVVAGRDLDYSVCYPRPSFDRRSIAWDLNYFKYYFLKLSEIPFHEEALEEDFDKLTEYLLSARRDYFLYRDFQSRNVMLHDGQPYFLDYQGGRHGALQYDIASLLFDAKAELPPALREELLNHYLDALAEHIPVDRQDFLAHYYPYVYIRIMQALGAYGYRGFFERKVHFLQSVPYALQNIRWLLHNVTLPIELPALMEAFSAMLGSEKLQKLAITEKKELTIVVTSFSFHRGPVQDESGNGGGFVFDARALPNPGREEQFKKLSGRDAEVIEYLEAEESVSQYLENAMNMVNASVRAYKKRRFTHLMVSYGCTGGQHRSVYLAEQTAKRLAGIDGLKVILRHREEESWVR
ncbi:conserved hypothetical protein [Candidatus Koribacter versatilis Ellin345]|uniref:Uncharacterized protein n=1 Tax=Koribacter versatilis (strain Ellin345) TaxID=204669 RepID=Q1IJL3_KORVE|nr:RNase adapter RapZ [Candidatus Koribacter versatilis]ABF42937.1 conserved hypothetical protein [Candidatus Koribacter versatilis Ellin345]